MDGYTLILVILCALFGLFLAKIQIKYWANWGKRAAKAQHNKKKSFDIDENKGKDEDSRENRRIK